VAGSLRQRAATRVIAVSDEVFSDRVGFWRPHHSPDWGRDWVMAGPVLLARAPDASTSKATEVPCETEAFVVQATQLGELPPAQLRPPAEESGKTSIARGPLDHELIVVQRAKVGRKIFHRLMPLFPVLLVAKPGLGLSRTVSNPARVVDRPPSGRAT